MMQDKELVRKSIVQHLISALTTDGWTTPGNWVIESYGEPPSGPPIVAVDIPQANFTNYEVGTDQKIGIYFVDIQVEGANDNDMEQLSGVIAKNLSGIAVIDFNDKMPGDDGYDATAQTLTYCHRIGDVKSVAKDKQNHITTVSTIMTTDKHL